VKTLLTRIFKNKNFLSLASNIVVAVFGFLSIIILARTLTPNYLGEWILYITAGNFFEMLRFGITRTAIIRFLSGSEGEEREKLIGSNWMIGLISTIIISVFIWTINIIFPQSINDSGFSLFFIWYPILAFLNLPFNNAVSILHAEQRFDKILLIRVINVGGFVLFLVINIFILKWSILGILYAHLIVNLLTSIICLIYKWDGIEHFFKANKKTNKIILNFGKFTTGTLIGSNLLKSSDTFLLGLSPFLGTTGVAFYSIPLKLTEILEIPLRSYVATAFPRMSKASINNNMKLIKRIFYSYSGGLTFLLLPVIIIGFIFAEEFVLILGGPEYIDTANIFRIFCIYGLFIPIDKFTGVTLDSINKPKRNFYKVIYMASANIIGDIVAIFMMSKFLFVFAVVSLLFYSDLGLNIIPYTGYQFSFISTLELVAFVTILFTVIGIIVGLHYLNEEIKLNYKFVFTEGWSFFKSIIKDISGNIIVKQKKL